MQSGEITVINKSFAAIRLQGRPSKVVVKFKDDHIQVSCNPTIPDQLEWEVRQTHHHHGGFDLHISWDVTNVREIEWSVFY
jgi:hypothetical protein